MSLSDFNLYSLLEKKYFDFVFVLQRGRFSPLSYFHFSQWNIWNGRFVYITPIQKFPDRRWLLSHQITLVYCIKSKLFAYLDILFWTNVLHYFRLSCMLMWIKIKLILEYIFIRLFAINLILHYNCNLKFSCKLSEQCFYLCLQIRKNQ